MVSLKQIKVEINDPCPLKKDADQTVGNLAVLVYIESNNSGFKCNHANCEDKGWDALQKPFPQTSPEWRRKPEEAGLDEDEVRAPEVTVDRFRKKHELINAQFECPHKPHDRRNGHLKQQATVLGRLQARSALASAQKKSPVKDGAFSSDADGNRTRNLRIDRPGL